MKLCRPVLWLTLVTLAWLQLSCSSNEPVSGANPTETVRTASATVFSLVALPNSSVVVAGPRRIVAYTPAGKEAWSFPLAEGDTVTAPPVAAANSNTYIRGAQSVYALAPDGKLLWQAKHGDGAASIKGILALGDSTMTITAGDNSLINYGADGKQRWTFALPDGDRLSALPVVSASSTIYLRGAKKVYAVNSDGTLAWQADYVE